MPEIPECLHRRYRALDELVKDLSSMSNRSSMSGSNVECTHDPGVKLMCDFWNILKEHPDCNLKKEVERRMGLGNSSYYNQHVTCYMSDCCDKHNDKDEKSNKEELDKKGPCCDDEKSEPDPGPVHICCPSDSPPPTSTSDVLPLSRVLCNLKEAASLDKDCSARVTDLMIAQANLKEQIQQLEQREKNGVNLLKQADCMWACMEDAYKTKIAESLERQKIILKELKEVEASANKWRKNKKDLEFQTNNITKCQQEIIEKINQKTSDKKCLEAEVADFKKRIENNKRDLDAAKKAISNKKQCSDAKIAAIATEMKKFQLKLQEEQKHKQDKEIEGNNYIKEAREDLQKLCSMMLQKKLENEDLKAEKEAIILEIDMLKQAYDECKEKCNNKKQAVVDEIKSLDEEIANFKMKCIKCHECVDTSDVRKLCTDCPRCVEDRECLYEEGQCITDPIADCVCMSVKHKFLDNVFDNMYTVLEKEAKTPPGKAVADAVLKCLKKSRNGKLNSETRKILQKFILTTVKKNLNLTIVGGAVKTRCEMDPETYKQLMLCLKDVKVTRPPKTDKGTIAKKDACPRWSGSSECNCPKGPKACVCTKNISEEPDDTAPADSENKGKTKTISLISKDTVACGTNCQMHAVPSLVGTELTSQQPSCQESSCPFSKNMRAAQCVLGPDSLSPPPKSKATPMPNILDLDSQISCTCGNLPEKSRESSAGDKKFKTATLKCDQNRCLSEHLNVKNCQEKYYLEKAKNTSFTSLDELIDTTQTQFHITILNESGQMEDHVSELVKTSSGDLAFEVDEKIIEILEKRTKQDPNFMGVLTKNKTGHIRIDFTANESDYNNCQKIKIKRAHSGTISFVADQSFISILKPGYTILHTVSKEQMKHDSFTPVIITQNRKNTSNMVKKVSEKENTIFLEKKAKKKILQECKSICKMQLQSYYDQGLKTITLKIQDGHEFSKYIVAGLRKTPSKNIVLEIENIQNFEKVINKTKQYPVLIESTDSDNFILYLRKQSNKPLNAILKKVCKGYLLILNDSMMKSSDDNENIITASGKECFKMRFKGSNINVVNPPVVLKRTLSNNYVISLDKEFEREYKKSINRYIGNDDKCCINLKKTNSGNYIITFEESKNYEKLIEYNAYLVKSSSGTIKVVTNGPEFHDITISESKRPSKAFEELLHKLPKSSLGNHNESIRKGRFITAKCQSYPYLLRNMRFLNTFTDSSTLLKKTVSGHYFVTLNKESKKAFIKSLKSYLAKNSQVLVPIRRTNSGQIIIYNKGSSDHNGTLQVTLSGNICVIFDKKIVLDNNKNENSTNTDDTNLHYYNVYVENPLNKGIGTTCNGNPDQCECISSKCICKELQYCMSDWFLPRPHVKYPVDISTVCAFRKYNESSLPNINASHKQDKVTPMVTPRIIIKPRDSQTILGKRRIHFVDYTKSVYPEVCPYHKDRYDDVSNELLEIPGLCSTVHGTNEIVTQKMISKPIKINFDNIEHLPPQLPSFLKDFSPY